MIFKVKFYFRLSHAPPTNIGYSSGSGDGLETVSVHRFQGIHLTVRAALAQAVRTLNNRGSGPPPDQALYYS